MRALSLYAKRSGASTVTHGGKWTATHRYLLAVTAIFVIAAAALWLTAPGHTGSGYRVTVERGAPERDGKIDINDADADTLTLLPGIGPVLGQRIVDYRQAHGPFTAPEQLLQVQGIGQKTLEGLRDYITWEENDEDSGGG
ncbi:MAG: helix-hairpin-helix domain-containing protein [Oscillospiraceae bacterium]|nr:helix-hairpin-helix domain-containing protein [Oscillospiraceae bacterium]